MKLDADAILKLSLAAAALMAGAGIGGYYGLYLPLHTQSVEAQAAARQADADKAQDKAAHDAAVAEAKRKVAAQTGYDDCVNMAGLAYRNRWNASCRAMRQSDIEAYQDCRDNWFSSDAKCQRKHPVRPAMDCDLPADVAAAYADDLDKAKAQCLGTLQGAAPQQSVPAPQPSL
ncbi:hypothetical protein [Novosphingobium sp. 9]|uniref:hypothetical protein n=1 Tax=Novosphingobium sp. 9 TaxID=2025349 RepID=UPI0021B64D70|nr:hypothetical protein [Novosphingobium sp. 9]